MAQMVSAINSRCNSSAFILILVIVKWGKRRQKRPSILRANPKRNIKSGKLIMR